MLERKKEPMGRYCGGSGVTPLLERVGLGSPISEDGLLDAVNLDYDKMKMTLKTK